MSKWKEYEAQGKFNESELNILRHLHEHLSVITNVKEFENELRVARRKYKASPSKTKLGLMLKQESIKAELPNCELLKQYCLAKVVRSSSGVSVITILTSPGKFSCPMDCYYCPNEPGQPRSYLSTEPAVLRANQCEWDPAIQFWDRARTLTRNGHTIDKIEILVLGGTWSGYPKDYQEEFIRDIFYAANVFPIFIDLLNQNELGYNHLQTDTMSQENNVLFDYYFQIRNKCRPRLSYMEEQFLNESSICKIIGITLETRPDYISHDEIVTLRKFGCTRVQIGIQHTNDEILNKINRGHTIQDAKNAIQLLKQYGYKIDIHLMPDLPGSSVMLDYKMFETVLYEPELQADQWKIYPCEVTLFTKIYDDYKNGLYMPYAESNEGERSLMNLILDVKKNMHPWIRLNRVIRDIPNQSIVAGNNRTNLRQILGDIAKSYGWKCSCIRCREVRLNKYARSDLRLVIRGYNTDSTGYEYFISFENDDRSIIYGFCRLRVPNFIENKINLNFSILNGRCGLIRELHVYGLMVSTAEIKNHNDARTQHAGLGSTLLRVAELICVLKGVDSIAIIAGVGTRQYYHKFGYYLMQTYMYKQINTNLIKKKIIKEFSKNELNRDITKLEIEHIIVDENNKLHNSDLLTNDINKGLIKNKTTNYNEIAKDLPVICETTHKYNWIENITIPIELLNNSLIEENTTYEYCSILPRLNMTLTKLSLLKKFAY